MEHMKQIVQSNIFWNSLYNVITRRMESWARGSEGQGAAEGFQVGFFGKIKFSFYIILKLGIGTFRI